MASVWLAELRRGEVSLCERSAGSGFQVLLKVARLRFGRKLDDNGHGPGSIPSGVSTRSKIVPLQSIGDIFRDPDVVAIRL